MRYNEMKVIKCISQWKKCIYYGHKTVKGCTRVTPTLMKASDYCINRIKKFLSIS